MSEPKIEITEKQLREVVEWYLSFFIKDISDPSHDVRDYESLNSNDIDEFSTAVFEELQSQHNRG